MPKAPGISRRALLVGACGVSVGLPFLECAQIRRSSAAAPDRPRFAVFVRQANGCAQADGDEPEQFWPRELGPLTQQSLTTIDADRAVSELAAFADKLLLVRGTRYPFPDGQIAPANMACAHASAGNQLLTARRSSDNTEHSRALGESIDNRIARENNPAGNPEPLTLYAGPMYGYIDEILSYRGPGDLRAAERNPWNVYQRLFGLGALPAPILADIRARRTSVNDLVKDQLTALMASPKLSRADQSRLELHRAAIRDIELELACSLPSSAERDALAAQHDYHGQDDRMQTIVKLHSNLIAHAFACDATRAATLQIGDGADGTQYRLDGLTFPRYHQISHRIYGDYDKGDPIPDAAAKHHRIDREHGKMFAHLLTRLSLYTTADGTLLDDAVAVWCNDLGAGHSHSYKQLPWVLAGSCGGSLRTGQTIDAGGVTHNRLLNTLLCAVGITDANGDPVTDFGDPDLVGGILDAMLTA